MHLIPYGCDLFLHISMYEKTAAQSQHTHNSRAYPVQPGQKKNRSCQQDDDRRRHEADLPAPGYLFFQNFLPTGVLCQIFFSLLQLRKLLFRDFDPLSQLLSLLPQIQELGGCLLFFGILLRLLEL